MYLSHLLANTGTNPDRPDWDICRRWLRNPYRVHQRLCMAFPSAPRKEADPQFLQPWRPGDFGEQERLTDTSAQETKSDAFRHVHAQRGERAGFLFRIDVQTVGGAVILVQSATEPDWGYAFANAAHFLAAPPQVRPYRPSFVEGQLLQFRLRANPTKKLSNRRTDREHGVRVGLYSQEEQRDWLGACPSNRSSGLTCGSV